MAWQVMVVLDGAVRYSVQDNPETTNRAADDPLEAMCFGSSRSSAQSARCWLLVNIGTRLPGASIVATPLTNCQEDIM